MLRNLGIVLLATILGGFIGGRLGWLSVTGRLARWQLLNAPPADAVEIFGGEPDSLLVRTEQGQVYHYTRHSWQEITLPVDFVPREDYHCYSLPTPEPPGHEIDRFADSTMCMETANQRYYVLLDDHSVWRWEHTTDATSGGLIWVIGTIAGLILGFILGLVFLWGGWVYSVWQRDKQDKEHLKI